MKQIMFLIASLSLVAVSCAEFKDIIDKACNTNTKLTEKQWIDFLACGKRFNDTHFAKYRAKTFSSCMSAGNESKLQALKLSGNVEQNQAVIEMCSENFNKCRMNLFNNWKKNQKKSDYKRGDGETGGQSDQNSKRDEWKRIMKCMKIAVGITES